MLSATIATHSMKCHRKYKTMLRICIQPMRGKTCEYQQHCFYLGSDKALAKKQHFNSVEPSSQEVSLSKKAREEKIEKDRLPVDLTFEVASKLADDIVFEKKLERGVSFGNEENTAKNHLSFAQPSPCEYAALDMWGAMPTGGGRGGGVRRVGPGVRRGARGGRGWRRHPERTEIGGGARWSRGVDTVTPELEEKTQHHSRGGSLIQLTKFGKNFW